MNPKKEEYNYIPVWYCKSCLSLKVIKKPDDVIDEYCGECGSTNIHLTSIMKWEQMYEYRYDIKYLDKKNGRK